MHSISDMVKLFKTQVQNIEICGDVNLYRNMIEWYSILLHNISLILNATIINIYRNCFKLKTDTRLD